jgi:hypothetical protein
MQELTFRSNANSKNVTSYKTFRELNSFIAPQVQSHIIDQVGDLCSTAGKTLAKTGGRYGKLFKAAGSLVKITGIGGKIALQGASKVSQLPIAPAAGVILSLSQIEELHNPTSAKYTDLIANAITLVKDIIETAGSLCIQMTRSLFDILFTEESEQNLIQGDIQNNSFTDQNESAEIAGNDIEQFFDMYSL